jgi:hypothetical protein
MMIGEYGFVGSARARVAFSLSAIALVLSLVPRVSAQGLVTITKLSTDTFTSDGAQHATEVEPDSFSFGSTIVSAFQVGRFFDGGSSDIGFATSTDGGATWTNGFLPGIANIEAAGNPYDRVSDPSVAYDPRHRVWLIASLPIVDSGAAIPAVIVSRSTDGINWDHPVSVTGDVLSSDKDWIVCDTWSSSPFYGHCYVEWDSPADADQINMSTSTDGGLTWEPPGHPATNGFGVGGQPVVQPNGTVVVPIQGNAPGPCPQPGCPVSIIAFRSTNGGKSWSGALAISALTDHMEAGNLRSSPLPSAAVDGGGRVYVVWQDCRFRRSCASNDIILSASKNGVTWTTPARIPIDSATSTVDHFIPGIDADKSSGSTDHLTLTYYFYPQTSCSPSTCRLGVGFISSSNGGVSWTAPQILASGIDLNWLPSTTDGQMVGDYISTSYVHGRALGFFAVARANTPTAFDEAIYTRSLKLIEPAGGPTFTSAGEKPLPNATSDHGPRGERSERAPHAPPPAEGLAAPKRGANR